MSGPLSFSTNDGIVSAGINKFSWRMDEARVVRYVRATLTTPQSSGPKFTIDIKRGDGSSIFTTPLSFDNGADNTAFASVPSVIGNGTFSINEKFSVDVSQIGDGTASGLKLTLYDYIPDFGNAPPPPTKSWISVSDIVLNQNSGAVQGYDYRFALSKSAFSALGAATKIRVTLKAASNAPSVISTFYAGLVTSAPNADTMTPIKFGGNPGVTIPAGGMVVSDETDFSLDPTRDLLLTFEPATPVLYGNTASGWTRYAKAVTGQAGYPSVSGYFSYNWQILISKVEVYA